MPLPPILSVYIYKAFGLLYPIKFDVFKRPLNDFRCFNDFFTRELVEGARTIEEPNDIKTLCSPCDGKILTYGLVDSKTCTLEKIKGSEYRVDEFLFGRQIEGVSAVDTMIKSTAERGNKTMFLVVYLAPSDYHRYHSPAAFTASYRRHIPGYLEPVDPRYLEGHRDVFKSNERVSVFGDWAHGFFAMSFVGATNVGSIKLHFDDSLRSNQPKATGDGIEDRNYATMTEGDSGNSLFWSYP